MKKLFSVLMLIAISSILAFGQDDYKKGEVFVGFSNNQVDTGVQSANGLGNSVDERESFNGFNVSGVYNVSRYVGIKGDVSGTYRNDNYYVSVFNLPSGSQGGYFFDTDSSLYNVLGGVQIKDNASKARVKPFAYALVGAGINRVKVSNVVINPCPLNLDCTFVTPNDVNETGLSGAFGGGIDIKLSKRIDLRAIQVDYNPIRFNGETQNNFRFGIGLVFK